VAKEYFLTARETEILELLARGRNSAAIQDKLVLSRNTIKTHVKNIYAKLGVHSQQELIDLVEQATGERR
jgi:DNA-binding CsgD family transcriptional regulator